MLHDTPCNGGQKVRVDGAWMEFSLASEGTKVSMHILHTLLGLIS